MKPPPSIYLVEDEAVIAMQLQDILRLLGYRVCGHAARGETALAEIPRANPDLVLMDINLPGKLTGIQVAADLRHHTDVPVVFLSAYSSTDIVADAVRTGPFGYLTKPVDEHELHATIEVALHRHREHAQLRTASRQSPGASPAVICPVCHRVQDTAALWKPLDLHLATGADQRFVCCRCPDCSAPEPQSVQN